MTHPALAPKQSSHLQRAVLFLPALGPHRARKRQVLQRRHRRARETLAPRVLQRLVPSKLLVALRRLSWLLLVLLLGCKHQGEYNERLVEF
jgi:hypothetical protein